MGRRQRLGRGGNVHIPAALPAESQHHFCRANFLREGGRWVSGRRRDTLAALLQGGTGRKRQHLVRAAHRSAHRDPIRFAVCEASLVQCVFSLLCRAGNGGLCRVRLQHHRNVTRQPKRVHLGGAAQFGEGQRQSPTLLAAQIRRSRGRLTEDGLQRHIRSPTHA